MGVKGERGCEELMSVPCEHCAASAVAIVCDLKVKTVDGW